MSKMDPNNLVAALSIAGSDSGGAAGIQADLLTFAACGVYGTTAITAMTAQNHVGISAVQAAPAAFVRAQVDQVLAYYPVRAIKVGMLLNAEIIEAVAEFVVSAHPLPVVVDPVMISSSGAMLLEPASLQVFAQKLLPNATLITPNFDEAAVLLGGKPETTPIAMEHAAIALARQFGTAVLLKGGHFPLEPVLDVLAGPEGVRARLHAPRVKGVDTHGGGCRLAAAITAYLALGLGLVEAVEHGHAHLQGILAAPPLAWKGRAILRQGLTSPEIS
jgi:hydroxymethylpyrimidine/phosphomethylpyrimidine kinase